MNLKDCLKKCAKALTPIANETRGCDVDGFLHSTAVENKRRTEERRQQTPKQSRVYRGEGR